MGDKITIKDINDFYSCETNYLFREILEKFNNHNISPKDVLFDAIDFLSNDKAPVGYSKFISDEVRGHFTRIAYNKYFEYNVMDENRLTKIIAKHRLEDLYREYYETSLSVTDFMEKSIKLKTEIEKLKKIIE